MARDRLIIEGVRQNNLKNISLILPHNRVIAVTGISGSGKSTLAFDTIFAEGQWRFIESLSTYARMFIEKLDRPDIDAITNIRPSIALQQHNPVRGSRSTVGTVTEIYDLLRVLFARVATPFCPRCNHEIRQWNPSSVINELVTHHSGEKAIILFMSSMSVNELKQKGFHRVFMDGQIGDIEDIGEELKTVHVVADRLVLKDSKRLSDALETAWRYGSESARVFLPPSQTLMFSRGNACDSCGYEMDDTGPILFSFNHPLGACPECKGFGNVLKYSPDLIIPNTDLSLKEGAIEPWEKPACSWWREQLIKKAPRTGIDINTPFSLLSDEQKGMLFSGGAHFHGIDEFFEELEQKKYKIHVRVFLSRYRVGVTCPSCKGKRLKPEALAYKLSGLDIADIVGKKIGELDAFFNGLALDEHKRSISSDVLDQIRLKLGYLIRVGLHYLSLDRQTKTLSGGEYQRINLSNQLASHLTGTLYVLDEPTVGLHARDTETISEIMGEIARLGNTVIVVEHDRDIIGKADWIVELGPGGGMDGGTVVYSGTTGDFLKEDTLTARYIRGDLGVPVPMKRRKGTGRSLVLSGARGNNLKDVALRIPLQTLTAVTGVSGSGKSSLVVDTCYNALARKLGKNAVPPLPFSEIDGVNLIRDVKLIDQSPIGRSPRSNPATYLKLFDAIRKCFAGQPEAKAKGYGPGFFSFNVPGGRCEECHGEGYQKIEMYFFEDIFAKCTACGGTRYSSDALSVTYRNKTIHDVLELTIDEAASFFADIRALSAQLSLLQGMGLGYLRIGQPATTLSGGEAQRLKICSELTAKSNGNTLYILDEPTVGLHIHDTAKLIKILNTLVDRGNTVVIIEHNLDLIRTADWIIDMGPEGGDGGGEIVFEGTPETLPKCRRSITGRYLSSLD